MSSGIQTDDKKAPQTEVKASQKSNVTKIEPRRGQTVKVNRKITEKEKKEREKDWEYVSGVFENNEVIGEAAHFWINPHPGDDYAEWLIPANTPVSVPRCIARHLTQRKYYTYKPIQVDGSLWQEGGFTESFQVAGEERRLDFKPMDMF